MRGFWAGIALFVTLTASAQAAPFVLTGDGAKPGVAVAPDGTGHVAWSHRVDSGADEIVYCRLPRGATACAATQTFVPDTLESFGGVRVLAPADGRVLLVYYRCCGANEGASVLESADGGTTFAPPRLIGSLEPWEAILGPGDQTVSMTNHVITAGIDYQAAPLAGGKPGHADLGTGVADQAYFGTVALVDVQTPVVAFSDLERVFVKTWGGSGDYNDVATWGPTTEVAAGDEPRLVGGPRGVHLAYLSGEPGERSYVVRPRLADGTFGPPSLKTPAGSPLNRDLYQDDGGFLHLTWEDNSNDTLHYRWSKDGKTWAADTVLAKGVDLFDQRTATGPDGGGFVVWDENNGGAVRAVAIPPKAAGGGGTGAGQEGECRQQVQVTPQVIAQARTGELCLKGGKWRTNEPVVINGLDFVPGVSGRRTARTAAVGELTIDASDHTVKTNGYEVRAGPVTLEKAPITWDVDKPKEFAGLDEYKVEVLGFPVTGKAILDVTGKGRAVIPVQVKLPPFFGGVTADVKLSLDIKNPLGLKLDELTVKQKDGESAFFFGLVLTDLDLHYSGASGTKIFEGTFTLSLPPKQAETPAITATVRFEDGKFVRGGFPRITFPTALPLAPPFAYLSAVGFVVEAKPNLKLIGGAEFVGGPEVAGAKLVVLDALPPVSSGEGAGGLAVTFGEPTAFDLDGKLKVAGIQLAQGGLHMDTDGLFTFYGGFVYSLFGVVDIQAGIPKTVPGSDPLVPGAFINFSTGAFGVTIVGKFCASIKGIDLVCGEGQGGLNSRAIYGCGKATILSIELPVEIGAAYEWGKDPFDGGLYVGCDYGDRIAVSATRAGGARTVTVPAGLPKVAFAVQGAGLPPGIRVTGPGGVDVTNASDPDAPAGAGNTTIMPYSSISTSFVEITDPAAGTYTINQAGSRAITGVVRQDGLRDPKVTAKVRRLGGRRFEVRYGVVADPGYSVTFSERSDTGNDELATVRDAKGRFRFSATDGKSGKRSIVALVAHEGIPRREVVVASYRAPGPVKPARPRGVKVRRAASTLRVSWRPAAGAAQYVVRVRQADGRSKLFLVAKSKRSFVYRGAGADKGTVTVSGLSPLGREGPAGKAAVKKKKRKRTRRG